VLVDSGSDAYLVESGSARKQGLENRLLSKPLDASALDWRLLFRVTHRSSPVQLNFPDHHTETTCLHLFQSLQHPLILGHPLLTQHNCQMDCASGTVIACRRECSERCFPTRTSLTLPPPTLQSALMLDPDYTDLSMVPACYLDLKEVFNKAQAISLERYFPKGPWWITSCTPVPSSLGNLHLRRGITI